MIRNGVWKILPQTKLFFVVRMCSVMSDSCDPLDCSPLGFSVHGILQARILEWVAMPSSRGSSNPGMELPPTWKMDSLPSEHQGSPYMCVYIYMYICVYVYMCMCVKVKKSESS